MRGHAAHVAHLYGKESYEFLECTQWDDDFERLMRNRLIMGGLRYGYFNKPGKPKYDRARSIMRRAQKYILTGNTEHLVDIANEALCEYKEPAHPNAHWEAQDDGEVHTTVL